MTTRAYLFAAIALVACGDPGQLGRSVVSPSDVTSKVALDKVPVKGAEIVIEQRSGARLSGELLAATDDSMTVLVGDSSVVRLRSSDVVRAIITRYENGALIAGLVLWSALGGLAGISHGFWLVVSEPIWGGISAGAIVPVAGDEKRFAYAGDRPTDFTYLHEYARFPQGLPPQYAARVH